MKLRWKSLRPVVCVFALALLCACDQDLAINPEFSVNLFAPGPKWPNERKLTPAQKEVYKRYGRPDNFRVFWNPHGTLLNRLEVGKQLEKMKPSQLPPYSWIFLKNGKEIVFGGSGYEERPLTDQVRTLVRYGDPEDVKELQNGVTEWMYFSVGKQYKFHDGALVEEKDFPALGRFEKP
jgi:hypothetical protein